MPARSTSAGGSAKFSVSGNGVLHYELAAIRWTYTGPENTPDPTSHLVLLGGLCTLDQPATDLGQLSLIRVYRRAVDSGARLDLAGLAAASPRDPILCRRKESVFPNDEI